MNPLKLPEGSVRAIIALLIVLSGCALAAASFVRGEPPAGASSGALLTAFGTVIEKYFSGRKADAEMAAKLNGISPKENP